MDAVTEGFVDGEVGTIKKPAHEINHKKGQVEMLEVEELDDLEWRQGQQKIIEETRQVSWREEEEIVVDNDSDLEMAAGQELLTSSATKQSVREIVKSILLEKTDTKSNTVAEKAILDSSAGEAVETLTSISAVPRYQEVEEPVIYHEIVTIRPRITKRV